MSYRKKLIEVSLPLNAINKESSREKSIRHGHPSTFHPWWARRPLAACRAVLFASLIDDPSEHPEEFPTEAEQDNERERLFKLIEKFVDWDNVRDENLLKQVRAEIRKATNDTPLPVLDPFAGGGSIPLEAQRLGLESHASDLNPVPVLINKALIEIPPKFANYPPVSSLKSQLFEAENNNWRGAHGLAEDVRYYGRWMRDEAEKRIGHFYPKAELLDGRESTVLAWIWARTVICPNPACGVQMPLVRSFILSKKKGKETWAEPIVTYSTTPPTINFVIKAGQDKPQEGTINRQGAKCLACGTAVPFDYIRSEARAGRMVAQLLAVVAESSSGRIYLSPTENQISVAVNAEPSDIPETNLPEQALGFRVQLYGMTKHSDLFTPRQLVALTTFSDLVQEARQHILADARQHKVFSDDERPLHEGGMGSVAYADAVATYLAIAVDRSADFWSSLAIWANQPKNELVVHTFTKQTLSMTWDFAEANPFSKSGGNFEGNLSFVVKTIQFLPEDVIPGHVRQQSATDLSSNSPTALIISTDPPYYDNIGYADLSDFFYIWLRRSLGKIYPDLFKTVLVPKSSELIATPYRFNGNKDKAQKFFEEGLVRVFERIRTIQHNDHVLTVYYAFKQAETEDIEQEEEIHANDVATVASTGWETMLESLIQTGFAITGTWPIRTERPGRLRDIGSNALASSIVLVCRPRPADAPLATRSDFLRALRKELPEALRKLQHGSIAPVDLAQASIGPGMSIYSRYRQVVESDGTPLRVRTALQMINQELDAALTEQEGEYDNETRWAIAWFEQTGMQEGLFGSAETLSKARNVSVSALEKSGLVEAKAGKVRLRRREELNGAWEARESSVWELTQRLIYTLLDDQGELGKQGGEIGAANLLRPALHLSESVRDLAYRLYALCERKGWAQEALAYNSLITSWTRLTDLAHRRTAEIQQGTWLTE